MTLEGASTRGGASTERMHGPQGWARKYRVRLFVTDLFVLAVVMVGAHAVRFGWDPFTPVAGASSPAYWQVTVAVVILWLLQLGWARSTEPRILGHGPQEFQRVLSASWRTFAWIAIIGFLTQWQISRGYLIFAIPVGTVALLSYRGVWRLWMHSQRERGWLQAQVLVVGPLRTSEQMVRRLRSSRQAGYNVIGVCLPSTSRGELADDVDDVQVVGTIDEAARLAEELDAEYVLLSGTDAMSLREARQLGWQLEGTGIGLIVAPAMVDVAGPRVLMSPVEGLPLLHVEAPEFKGAKALVKGAFDRATAGLILLVGLVPMLVIALAIRATSPGPALFRQERVGRDHEPFTIYKFRSMYIDAEARKAALLAQNEGNGVHFKMKSDPRVTPVGALLRRFSLDELPQLINVLKGEMSLVGPRPPLASEVEQWDERVSRRQLVKPGLTGLWQVSGRSDLSWDEAVRLDLYYTENWSLAGDFVIILRTIGAVLFGRGAY